MRNYHTGETLHGNDTRVPRFCVVLLKWGKMNSAQCSNDSLSTYNNSKFDSNSHSQSEIRTYHAQ